MSRRRKFRVEVSRPDGLCVCIRETERTTDEGKRNLAKLCDEVTRLIVAHLEEERSK